MKGACSGLILTLMGIVLTGWMLTYLPDAFRLAVYGKQTTAVLTNKSKTYSGSGRKASPRYHFDYRGEDGEREFSGSDLVDEGEFTTAQIGDPIVVIYLPADLRVNRIGGRGAAWLRVFGMIATTAIFAAVMLGSGMKRFRGD